MASFLVLGQVAPAPVGTGPSAPQGSATRRAPDTATSILTVQEPEEATVTTPRNPHRFEVGALAEVRSGHPNTSIPTAQTEIEIDPIASLRLPVGPGGLTVSYEPRLFIIGSSTPGENVYYLHKGHVALDTQAPRARYFLTFYGAYGQNDFLPLTTVVPQPGGTGLPPAQEPGVPPTTQPTPTPTPGNGRLPDQRFLAVVNLDGSAGLVYAVSPRVSWLASAGYLWSGGANSTAQQSLPLVKGPYGSTGPIWAMSSRDTLAALLHGYHSRFSSGPLSTGVDLTATWTHRWSSSLDTDLIGGAEGFHTTLVGQPAVTSAYAVGGFGIHHDWIRRRGGWRNSLQVLVAPVADRLSGVVYQRVAGVLASTWLVNEKLSFNVTGSGAVGFDGTQRDIRVEGRVTYALAEQVTFSAGGRMAWLSGSDLLGPSGFGWTALATITTRVGAAF
jgi:hypothetical protein